jgi:hypothetical protein
MKLPASEGSSVSVHRGSLSPIFGWVSREFDQRRPAPTIVWRARLADSALLRTELLVAAEAAR